MRSGSARGLQLRKDVPLRIEQQADGALPRREIAHVAGQHGVQVTDAVRSAQRKYGAEVAVHQCRRLPRQAMFAPGIAKPGGLQHSKIRSKRGPGGAMHLAQRRFDWQWSFFRCGHRFRFQSSRESRAGGSRLPGML